MKKSVKNTIFKSVVFCLLAGLSTTILAEISYDSTTHTYSGSGVWEEAVTITESTKFVFNDTVAAQFNGVITANNTVTKSGIGSWDISNANTVFNSPVVISGGTVTLYAQRSNKVFQDTVTITEGATLVSGRKDVFGYAATSEPTKIYLNNGTLHKTFGADETDSGQRNETLGSVDIYFKEGTMSSESGGRFDILRSDVRFFAQATEKATAESPAVSNISAPLLLRKATESNGFTVDVSENAHLNITSAISVETSEGTTAYPTLIKTGAGLLTLTTTGNAGIDIREGTTTINGTCNGSISVASGATINVARANNASITVAENGVFNLTGVNHSQLDILKGTVQVTRGGSDRLMANNGIIHIRDGGILNLAKHDSLGYSRAGSTNVHIYQEGKMINTIGNDSFRNMTFYLYGGEIDSTTGRYDILNSLNFNILPAEGVTKTTISTVSGTWNFRTETDLVLEDDIFSLNVAENAELKFNGRFTESGNNLGNGTIVKSGNGVLRLTNSTRGSATQPVTVEAGTLIAENNALSTTSHLTVAAGAIFDPTSGATSLTGSYTLAGKQNIYFTEDRFNSFDVSGTIDILDTAEFFLISDDPLDYNLFLEESFTIMEVTKTDAMPETIPILFDSEVFGMSELRLMAVWNDGGTALVTQGRLPEPSTWLLLALSLGGWMVYTRTSLPIRKKHS